MDLRQLEILQAIAETGSPEFSSLGNATEIGWSSTHRSVATATACVNLYNELIAVAAEVEANFENARIFKLYAPKPAAVEETATA